MRERDHERPAPAPMWQVTLSDMTMGLMVFFIAMFATTIVDQRRYFQAEERLEGISRAGRGARTGEGVTKPEEMPSHWFEEMLGKGAGEQAAVSVRGHLVRVLRTAEGVTIRIGDDVAPFAEGSWELRPEHRDIIAEVKRWMRGRLNVVMVRGHTAGNWEDSVVLEDGRVRAMTREDMAREDRVRIADPWLLSALRANAVRAELVRSDVEGEPGVEERRVRVVGDAFTKPIADSGDPRERGRNRRVEVVVSLETVPE